MSWIKLSAVVCVLVAVCLAHEDERDACAYRRHFRGCRASLGKCICSRTRACKNPFPYRSKNECMADIKGKADKCTREPCVHGVCTQTKVGTYRSWFCECAGSGYHGYRCEIECPRHSEPSPRDYPAACAMVDDEEVAIMVA